MKRLALLNKDRDDFQYNSGVLVYIFFTPNKSAKDSIKKGFNQIHRSFSSL